MKRHHIVAVFLLIYGGLFAYITLDDGDTARAIRMGIFCTLLGVFSFFSGRLRPRFRSIGVTVILLIALGISAYWDFIAGDIWSVIILGVLMISVVAPILFRDTPFVKEKIRPWLKPVPYIGGIVPFIALILLLLLLFFT